jgi:hypothetical protein
MASSIPSNPRDHVAWLDYWADETVLAIKVAVERPPKLVPWDLDLEHAVRCARAAAGRALRLSPRRVKRLL